MRRRRIASGSIGSSSCWAIRLASGNWPGWLRPTSKCSSVPSRTHWPDLRPLWPDTRRRGGQTLRRQSVCRRGAHRSAGVHGRRPSRKRLHQLRLDDGQPTILSSLGPFAEWVPPPPSSGQSARQASGGAEEVTRNSFESSAGVPGSFDPLAAESRPDRHPDAGRRPGRLGPHPSHLRNARSGGMGLEPGWRLLDQQPSPRKRKPHIGAPRRLPSGLAEGGSDTYDIQQLRIVSPVVNSGRRAEGRSIALRRTRVRTARAGIDIRDDQCAPRRDAAGGDVVKLWRAWTFRPAIPRFSAASIANTWPTCMRGFRGFEEAFQAFLLSCGLSWAQIDEIEAATRVRGGATGMRARPLPGVAATIGKLNSRGLPLAVLTDSPYPAARLDARIGPPFAGRPVSAACSRRSIWKSRSRTRLLSGGDRGVTCRPSSWRLSVAMPKAWPAPLAAACARLPCDCKIRPGRCPTDRFSELLDVVEHWSALQVAA